MTATDTYTNYPRQARSRHEVPGTILRVLRHIPVFERGYYVPSQSQTVEQADEATVVSSEMLGVGGMHAPVIDIDIPAELVPSSTPGHFHLYLDVPMTQRQMLKLLKVMAEVGVVEEGFYQMSRKQGYANVRLPWIKK